MWEDASAKYFLKGNRFVEVWERNPEQVEHFFISGSKTKLHRGHTFIKSVWVPHLGHKLRNVFIPHLEHFLEQTWTSMAGTAEAF